MRFLKLLTASFLLISTYSNAAIQESNLNYINDFKSSTDVKYINNENKENLSKGFLAKSQSSFKVSKVKFGIDSFNSYSVKINSNQDSYYRDNKRRNESQTYYDSLQSSGRTLKASYSKTNFKLGTLFPNKIDNTFEDDVYLANSFEGFQVNTNQINKLNLTMGRITSKDDLTNLNLSTSKNVGFSTSVKKGVYSNFLGSLYKVNDNTNLSYYLEEFDNNKYNYLTFDYNYRLSEKDSIKFLLNHSFSDKNEDENYVNNSFGSDVIYKNNIHSFGIGYKLINGKTNISYFDSTDSYLNNYSQNLSSAVYSEKIIQFRHDYNFKDMGISGLVLTNRYVKGFDISRNDVLEDGSEWQRNTVVSYQFKEGKKKNLTIKIKNKSYRSTLTQNNTDEFHIIASYPFGL